MQRYAILKSVPLFLAALLAGGCAAPRTNAPTVESVAAELEAKKQRELVLEAFLERQLRLERVGYPILEAALPHCPEKRRYTTGAWFWNKAAFPDDLKEAAAMKYGVTGLVQVGPVREGSPAAVAGLKLGDVPVKVDDWEVPTGPDAFETFVEHLDERLKTPGPMTFQVRRGGVPMEVTVTPKPICDYRLVVERNDAKNAYADGERIVVYQGMMEFLKTDEELATVIAHEAAHNVMGHIDAKKTNAVIGGVFGLVLDIAAAAAGVNSQGEFTKLGAQVGAGTYSVEFEQEADYVGLYLMANAGYDERQAPNLWRKMAIQNPKAIEHRTSHPTTPERFVALEKSVEEIAGKRISSTALMPEMKLEGSAVPPVGADTGKRE